MNEPNIFGYGIFPETICPTDVMLLYIAAEHPEQLGEPITRTEMAAIATSAHNPATASIAS